MSGPLFPQRHEVPHAEPAAAGAPFWKGCSEGVLLFQRCRACRSINFPPVENCRECQDADLAWEPSAGSGTLYSWTVVHRPVTPAFEVPYAPAIVDMDEGYQVLTNLIEVEPGEIAAGMPVEVRFHEAGPGVHLPYFRPRTT